MEDMKEDNSIILTFDYDMQQVPIGLNDLAISITSDVLIKFDWTASYSDLRTLKLQFTINSALQGGETLSVRLVNYKVFRSSTGGCVLPDTFSTTLESSLTSTAASAAAASGFMQYIIVGGMVGVFGLLL